MQEDQKQPPQISDKDYRSGHRKRLRGRFREGGQKAVQEYELLEMVLFRPIPRRDVKLLAHELIDRFGDLSAVLSAPRRELTAIKGISHNVVDEFELIRAVALNIGQATIINKKALANWDALLACCRTKMAENKIEEFHVIFLDKQNNIIADEQRAAARPTIRRSIRARSSNGHWNWMPLPSSLPIITPQATLRPRAPILK